jgi:radical SAM superfamily enzyme YgiQ (UPF0313 family)
MPLTLSYIASLLKKNGHEVELIDGMAEKISLEKVVLETRKFKPSLIILNTAFPSITYDLTTASFIKRQIHQTKIAVIGMFPTLLKEKVLKEHDYIDFAIFGEPEWVVKGLAQSLENGKQFDEIDGLIFRKRDKIIINEQQKFIKNKLEELPLPARDILKNEAYTHVSDNKNFTLLSINRGCPYSCSFCTAHHYYGKTVRKRSVKAIISEIHECVNKYNIKKFLFWGESFTLDNDYAMQICNEIIKYDLNIEWYTRSRVDTVNYDLLYKMKQAGCKGISYGIESINQKVLDRCNKGIEVSQIIHAIDMSKKAGLNVVGHFIFGLPGDNKESANETIRFAKTSGLDYAQFYGAVPYPQTELWELASKNNWVESADYSDFHLANTPMRNEYLNSKEIKQLRQNAIRSFYNKPKMYLKSLSLIIKRKSFSPVIGFFKWAKV